MTIELAVLDIAGTTVQEHNSVYVALQEAVAAAGGSPTTADIQRWMGADKTEAITALLSDTPPATHHPRTPPGNAAPDPATVSATFDDFRLRLAKLYAEKPPAPLPGVPQALAKLRAAGVRVALTTGFDRTVTDGLLAAIGWTDGVVDAVVCVDDVAAGRPAPYLIFRAMERTGVRDVARVLTAGDTVRDLQAGVNAGVGMVVGVLTGGQSATELGAERHTHLLPSVAELPALLGHA